MPLDARQRKIIASGQAACAECGSHLADLRRRGFPNEQLEAKHEAMTQFFNAGDEIVEQFDKDHPPEKRRGK